MWTTSFSRIRRNQHCNGHCSRLGSPASFVRNQRLPYSQLSWGLFQDGMGWKCSWWNQRKVRLFKDDTFIYKNSIVQGYKLPVTLNECQKSCLNHPKCNYWTWMKPLHKSEERGNCVLKTAKEKTTSLPHFISGSKNCSMSDQFISKENKLDKIGHKFKLEKIVPKTLGFIFGNHLICIIIVAL